MRVGVVKWLGWMAALMMAVETTGCARLSGLFKDGEPAAGDDAKVPLRLERANPYGGALPTPPPSATAATTAGAPRTDAPSGTEIYRLRPQDTIIVTVHNPQMQQSELTIDENGFIRMPLIDEVKAAGLTPAELEKSIRDQYLNRKFYKYITVNVNLPMRSYFISGEVKAPGRFPLVGGVTTLRQAIAAAGGYTDFADRRKIEVKRGNNTMRFSAEAIDKGEQNDLMIETGDVINVNRSWY